MRHFVLSSSAEWDVRDGHSGNTVSQKHPHDVSGGDAHAALATKESKWLPQYPMMTSAPGMKTIVTESASDAVRRVRGVDWQGSVLG